MLAFTASSVAAGLGGAVLCFVAQAVSPGAYTVGFSLLLVVAVVIGGLGSILGAALGSVVVVLLPWLIGRLTAALPGRRRAAPRRQPAVLVFGVLLITVMALAPQGLARRPSGTAGAGRARSPTPRPHRPAGRPSATEEQR